jgi:signal peptidase II
LIILEQKLLKWVAALVVIVVLDQVTKALATSYLSYGIPFSLFEGLNFTLLHNTGAAFSFLHDQNGWQRWFLSIVTLLISIGLVVWFCSLRGSQTWMHCAICFVLAGAIGNLLDRLVLGYVVDFIQLYWGNWYWPAFNLADTSICVGVVMMVFGNSEKQNAV